MEELCSVHCSLGSVISPSSGRNRLPFYRGSIYSERRVWNWGIQVWHYGHVVPVGDHVSSIISWECVAILWTITRVNFVYTRKNYRRILWTMYRLWILWTRTRVNFLYTRKNYRRILWTRLWFLWSRTRVNFCRVGYWLFGFFMWIASFLRAKAQKSDSLV